MTGPDISQISDLVRASIETKIIEAFKSTPEMIDQLVHACLHQEVDSYGQDPTKAYSYKREKMPYLTYLARSTIQQVARKAVESYIMELEPKIYADVKEALSKAELADSLSKSILKSATQDWRIKVEFEKVED